MRNGAVISSRWGVAPAVSLPQLSPHRIKQLYEELAFALSRTDKTALRNWGGRSAGRLFHLGARRVGGLARLTSDLARFGGDTVVPLADGSKPQARRTRKPKAAKAKTESGEAPVPAEVWVPRVKSKPRSSGESKPSKAPAKPAPRKARDPKALTEERLRKVGNPRKPQGERGKGRRAR